MRTLLAAALLAAGLAGTAQAALIGNGAPDLGNATDLNANLGADDFSLAADSTVTQLRFWTAQVDTADFAGSIEYSFRSDAGGAPGAVVQSGSLASTQTSTGLDLFGLTVFLHEVTLSVDLLAGDYWLVLHNGPNGSQPATSFYWAFHDSSAGNAQAFDLTGGGPWGTVSGELAFELETTPRGGNVPEPGSLALVAAALAALSARRIRRSA